ncbi:MAG: FadR family transcriptional regulator [Proteobacteria bacterium]|nr:FadR family transcriptional regulator [Pseudomonadota bacterium]
MNQIERAIVDGQLEVGDKLPPQRELCETFETSRGSIREALRVLEQKGLIEIKLGVNGGAFVKSPDTKPVQESLALLLKQRRISIDELAEFREGMEGHVAEIAALKIAAPDRERILNMAAEAEKHLGDKAERWEQLLKIDKAFHLFLAKIAGNTIYESISLIIHENMGAYHRASPPKDPKALEKIIKNLGEIARAVAGGESVKGRTLTRRHIRFLVAQMKESTSASKGT